MPGFRFPVSVPASLSELFERIRELLPQLELKVLPDRPVGTTETVIAHGLKSTPVFVVTGNPHCIAIVKETRRADSKHIYLKATNSCVVNVWTLAVGSLGASIVPDGGYRLPDWDPAGDALGDHKFAIDSADDAADGADFAETKIVAGSGTSIAKVTGSHGKALQIACTVSPTPLSDQDPLPDAAEADPGNGTEASRWDHVHPLVRPSKIRYYLSDTVGSGEYIGNLLLTENPYPLEVNAVDYVETNQSPPWAVFVSAPGSPGLAVWQGGVVHAHLRVKLINPQAGRTYKLYTGNGDIVYTAMVWDWTHSDTYQVKESAPAQPTITTDYQTIDFDLPVTALAAGTDGRLGLNMRLRVYVGSDEAVFSNEKIVIRIGGDNASYLDTLFTPDGGFSGVHNDLDGRDVANCHPMASITPGRIQTPANPNVTSADGLFAVPLNSNFVVLDGSEDLIGCSTEGWTGPGWIEVHILNERNILRSQSVPTGYAAFMWGSTETGYGADYDVQVAYAGSIFRFRWTGGVWRIAGIMNM